MSLVPSPFLFRFTVPVTEVKQLPRKTAPLIRLPQTCQIPIPGTIESSNSFATVAMGWNANGLAMTVTVAGKPDWPKCSPKDLLGSDGVQFWLDTRDTKNIHRASRYCYSFALLPLGDGDEWREPLIKQLPVSRAGEDAAEIDLENLLVESDVSANGYQVSIWFPTGSLSGFDPTSYSRLGFSMVIHDNDLGDQFFTVNQDFPFDSDPSLWATLELGSTSAGDGD